MKNTTIINIFNKDSSNIAYINPLSPHDNHCISFYCNAAFIISNIKKHFPQNNLLFVCLQLYKHNCL